MQLAHLLTFSIIGAVVIVLISLGMDSIIKGLDDMLIPCQHGTEYNKLTGSCRCDDTPFSGKYCGVCDCTNGQCVVGGTTERAGSLYGCRCPINTKWFGFMCDMCFTENANATTCTGPCKAGYYGEICDKTCKSELTFSQLTASDPSEEAKICLDIRTNGGTCNVCSGHGSCTSNGNCDCDKNWFDGPNGGCSRTCEVVDGKVCSGHGNCVNKGGQPSCACEFGWRGIDCSLPCPGINVTGLSCSGHGNCLVDYTDPPSTSCSCNQKFRGFACEIECPGEVIACSGHGTCDNLGVCECNGQNGGVLWEGKACQCNDFITCSGNGECNSETGECECIGNFAGKHCRECKRNYYGSKCQFYCDENAPTINSQLGCYGRGLCSVIDEGLSTETVECECTDTRVTIFDEGKQDTYRSNYEQESNCRDCSPGYLPLVATLEHSFLTSGTNENSISRDECRDLATLQGVVFQDAYVFNAPTGCSMSTDGDENIIRYNRYGETPLVYIGDNTNLGFGGTYINDGSLQVCEGSCQSNTQCRQGLVCKTRLLSEAVPGCKSGGEGDKVGKNYCYLDDSYGTVDLQCSQSNQCIQAGTTQKPPGIYVPCQLSCTDATCNNLGECNLQWGLPGLAMCKCDQGPQNRKHLNDSDYCLSCETNWFPQNVRSDTGCTNFCIADIASLDGTFPAACDTGDIECVQCSGNGHCGPEGKCICDEGFTGTECNIECIGNNGLECSGHGKCVVNELQELMQFEYQFVGNSGSLFSCECDPQDPYTEEERINFRLAVKEGRTSGKLEDPPIKNYYGEFCEYYCTSPPWYSSEICNGFGECEINKIETPTGGQFNCVSDEDCSSNGDLAAILSAVSDWGIQKGPFCHKADAPPGCLNSNFTNSDCYYILSLQRPTAARSKECMREESCRTFMDTFDWHDYCTDIETALNPLSSCPTDAKSYCDLFDSDQSLVIDPDCAALVDLMTRNDMKVSTQLNYCYEKDKSKYPFKMTEAYRFVNGIQKHDDVAEEFEAFGVKYPDVSMDATNFCTNYLKRLDVEVSHIRSDKLWLCNGRIQHHDSCTTEALELDSIRQPFYVHCTDGSETKYNELSEAIRNRKEGCVIVEEVVDVTNGTLDTLSSIRSSIGQPCVDNHDCFSNSCFESTCCANTTDTTNCKSCLATGGCECLPGSTVVNGTCTYDGISCISPSYWQENVGCVNGSFGQSCTHDKNCAVGKCYSNTCCSTSPNCKVCGANGACTECITDATLADGSCIPNVCDEGHMFVEDEGCVARPSDVLENQVQTLLDATCQNAESIFPQCRYPTNACNINGKSACNDGDVCEPAEKDAICTTRGVLNATCKFGLQVERIDFSTYRCVGNFEVNNTCLREARDFNWFSFCRTEDPVRFHDNFGNDALQENHQPSHIMLQEKEQDGDLLSFWIKTDNVIKTSNPLLLKSGNFDVARIYLHQQQIQLNEIAVLQSCPINQPTCNDNYMYNAHEWMNIKVELDYSTSTVRLHYNGNTKEDSFLCSNCVVHGITELVIEEGNAKTYYDEILFSREVQVPSVKTHCHGYSYCDFNVDYREKCIDLLTNIKYPHIVEPKNDIIHTCLQRKEEHEYVGASGLTAMIEDEMDALNWTTFCKFQKELDEDIMCHGLDINNLEKYTDACSKWVDPVDIIPVNNSYNLVSCVKQNLELNWKTYQCPFLDEAYMPTQMREKCPQSCYKHMKGYDQCDLRNTIFDSNEGIPEHISGCSNVHWLNWCNDVAKNTHPGVCSAVQCNCDTQKNEGMTGDSCELHCSIASDGSPCGIASGAGVCKYTKETLADLENGPYTTQMYEIAGECECFNSEGTSNCDQECAQCTNTTYTYHDEPMTLSFGTPLVSEEEIKQEEAAKRVEEENYKQSVAAEQTYKQNAASEQDQKQSQAQAEQNQKTLEEQNTKAVAEQDAKNEQALKTQQEQQAKQGGFGGGYRRRLHRRRLTASDSTHQYVYNGETNPTIKICTGTEITIERSTSGHPLRLVHASDCTGCDTGVYTTLPSSSIPGWTDVTINNPTTITLLEPGTYYYVCTVHPEMVGKIVVSDCGGQIGICDASRGLCQCLPPFVIERHEEYTTWKGDVRTRLKRNFDLPRGLSDEEVLRIRMMQGKETFVRQYLDTDATEDNWKTT